jgi:hypothetical protein
MADAPGDRVEWVVHLNPDQIARVTKLWKRFDGAISAENLVSLVIDVGIERMNMQADLSPAKPAEA